MMIHYGTIGSRPAISQHQGNWKCHKSDRQIVPSVLRGHIGKYNTTGCLKIKWD